MYRASAAVLAATAQIGADRNAPPEALREHMVGLLRDFVSRSRAEGVPDVEVAEARYAIVALIDDRALKSSWHGRAEWQSSPLQLQLYREFTAGENFFARLSALLKRGGPLMALEAYYLCLVLGFVGAMPGGGGQQARPLIESARKLLLHGGTVDRFAPNAIPEERHRPVTSPFPLARVSVVSCVAVCLLALVGLQLALGGVVKRARQDLSAAQSTSGALPSAPEHAR
jgi:type IV/VI secretion system ImpK/VasF family protein